MKEQGAGLMRSIGIRLAGTAFVLLIVVLAGGYVLKSGYDRRLTAIEQKIFSLENSGQQRGGAQAFLSSTPSQTTRQHAWLEASRAPYRALLRPQKPPQQSVRQRQQNRLTALEANFEREQVDNAWAVQTEADVRDMLAYAVATSGVDPTSTSVKCRGSSCRIEIDMALAAEPEDLLLQLSVDMAGTLPRSKSVVLSDEKGSKRLSIFATR